jgi:hypothetical protein
MDTETTETDVAAINGGEGENQVESVTVPKGDYDKLNQTLGSLKKELKDLKKAQEKSSETPTKETKTEESALLQRIERMSLRQAGITHQDDIELAQKTAKKWGVDIDEVLADEDFKVKLERQQTARDNAAATTGVRGGGGSNSAKNDPAYWLAKGTPPSREDVPDRKTRAKINRAFMENAGTSGKKFYND